MALALRRRLGWSCTARSPLLGFVLSHYILHLFTHSLTHSLSAEPSQKNLGDKDESDVEQSLEKPAPEYSSRGPSEEQDRANQSHDSAQAKDNIRGNTVTSPPPQYSSPNLPSALSNDTNQMRARAHPDTTLASLASFPAPPTHFPVPPITSMMTTPVASPQPPDRQQLLLNPPRDHVVVSTSYDEAISTRALPAPEVAPRPSPVALGSSASPMQIPPPPPLLNRPNSFDQPLESKPVKEDPQSTPSPRLLQDNSPLTESPNPSVHRDENPTQEDVDATEFGARRQNDPAIQSPEPARSIERTDTGRSSGSMVAALRDRLARRVCCIVVSHLLCRVLIRGIDSLGPFPPILRRSSVFL